MITKQSAFLQNRATILEFLYRNPATSRTDIVNETGLTPATTTNIIKELSEQSLIYETGDEFSEFSDLEDVEKLFLSQIIFRMLLEVLK